MCPKHFFRDECEVKKHVYLDLSVARIDNWGSVHVMSNWILLCNSRSSIEEIIYLLIILIKNMMPRIETCSCCTFCSKSRQSAQCKLPINRLSMQLDSDHLACCVFEDMRIL